MPGLFLSENTAVNLWEIISQGQITSCQQMELQNSSLLSVDDFLKKSSIISYSRNALSEIHEDIEKFAEAEQLTAHANSIKVRFE